MSKTLSTMLDLGVKAPEFSLPDTENKLISLDSFNTPKGYLIMFICNHCPFVVHIRDELKKITDEFIKDGGAVIAINSNDVENYPDDSPAKMAIEKQEQEYHFSYLYDETQSVAKAYKAACTPDFFLFDQERSLFYRGQLDDSRPGNNIDVTGNDLRKAIEDLLGNSNSPVVQKPSMGCNIKWKPGNEPTYFG